MRAAEVIATHTSAGFDAYASMLAARRLYPQAVVCLPGSLDHQVRELHLLLAGEIDAVDVARVDPAAIRRLVVVDTVHAERLDERLQAVAGDGGVEKVVFDHHGEPPPAWADAELVVVSADGALTSTLVGILAGRGITVTALEATAFALGIHEGTGSLTSGGSTERDAEALAWCMRHGARQDLVSRFLRTPLDPEQVTLFEAGDEALPSIAVELGQLERAAPLFEAVRAVSEGSGGVYLVGGTVRDILLGEPGFDIDIAVEGDAIAFARRLAKALHGRVRTHERFGTATVSWGDGEHVDLVTARSELYDAPGALPTVERSTIRDDLLRRDFTINAIAASLRGSDFGRLVDPFGGRRDLAARTIRVLHDLSFSEDPTRLFRSVRYETRYGFRMDARTERLARACVALGLVGELSGARLREELVAILEDAQPGRGLARLGELGVAAAVDPALATDPDTVDLVERLRALGAELAPEVPAWRLGLAVAARRLAAEEASALVHRLKLRRRDADAITAAVGAAPRLVRALRGREPTPAEVVALAEPYPADVALVALALEESAALRAYLASWRDVRLAIGGAELAELGLAESPRVGEVLEALRRRKLNGELAGRAAELAAARELIAATPTEVP